MSGNSLGSTELNSIDSNICSLDTSTLRNITTDSIRWVGTCCSAMPKQVICEWWKWLTLWIGFPSLFLRNAKPLNLASCSFEQKQVLYKIANTSFSSQSTSPNAFYNLIRTYLGEENFVIVVIVNDLFHSQQWTEKRKQNITHCTEQTQKLQVWCCLGGRWWQGQILKYVFCVCFGIWGHVNWVIFSIYIHSEYFILFFLEHHLWCIHVDMENSASELCNDITA